jgi:hypothetical protein
VEGMGRYYLPGPDGPVGMDGFRIAPVSDAKGAGGPVSSPGDSGSTWYGVRDQAGVGLHVAGEITRSPEEHGIACYLGRVLERLGVGLAVPAPPPGEDVAHRGT